MDKRRPNLFRLFCTSFVIILSIIAVDLVKRQLIPVTENIIPKGCFKSGVSSPVLPVSPTSYKPVNFPNSTPQNTTNQCTGHSSTVIEICQIAISSSVEVKKYFQWINRARNNRCIVPEKQSPQSCYQRNPENIKFTSLLCIHYFLDLRAKSKE